MIIKLPLNTQIKWIFMKVLKNIYEKIEEQNLNQERKILIVFDDMIAMVSTQLQPIFKKIFIRNRNVNIFLVCRHNLILLSQENIRLNSAHYSIIKFPNKGKLQQIAFNHSSDMDLGGFMNLTKTYFKTVFFFSERYSSCIR